MTLPSDCPACGGTLTEVMHSSDDTVCEQCGRVNPLERQTEELSTRKDTTKGGGSIKVGWNSQGVIKDSSDQNIAEMLSYIGDYIHQLELDENVQIRTAELAISAWEAGLSHGRSKESIVAGCLYAASRELECPRPLTNVSEITELSESELNNSYRVIVSKLELTLPIVTPEDYLDYLGQQMNLPNKVINKAEKLVTSNTGYNGNPAGIASAALYLVGNRYDCDITLVQAGQAAGVAKETVWRNTQSLEAAKSPSSA